MQQPVLHPSLENNSELSSTLEESWHLFPSSENKLAAHSLSPSPPPPVSLSSLPKENFLKFNMHHWFRALFSMTGKFGRRSTWLSKELLNELKCKAHKKWKQGQTTKEKYKSTAQTCWDKTRKTKAQLDLKLDRNIKTNKMWFYKHVRSEKKLRERVSPFLNGRKPSEGKYGKGCSMAFCQAKPAPRCLHPPMLCRKPTVY